MSRHADHCAWTILEYEEDSQPVMIRLRGEIPPGVNTDHYPTLVNIYWAYESSPSGMPGEEEMARMHELDDLLNENDGAQIGFMMFSVTGNGRKEWIWYIRNADQFIAAVNESLQDLPLFPIEIEATDAADWTAYWDLINALPADDLDEAIDSDESH